MDLRKTIKKNPKFDDYILSTRPNISRNPSDSIITMSGNNNDSISHDLSEDIVNINELTSDSTINTTVSKTNIKMAEPEQPSAIEVGVKETTSAHSGEATNLQTDAIHRSLDESERDGIMPSVSNYQCHSDTQLQPITSPTANQRQPTTTITETDDQIHLPENTLLPQQSTRPQSAIETETPPVWISQLFTNINNLCHRIDSNNQELSDKIQSINSKLSNKIQSNHQELSNRIENQIAASNDKLSNKLSNEITHMEARINGSIKHYVSTLDSKISTLNEKIDQNTEDIKSIKISHHDLENKIHMARNENKADLFKTITEFQRNTTEVITEQCQIIEDRIHTQIDTIEDKINQSDLNHTEQLNKLEIKLDNRIDERINNDQTIKLNQIKIDKHEERLNKLNESIIQQQEEIKNRPNANNNGQPTQIYVTCTGNGNNNFDQPLPKFNGRSYNPNEYLNRFKKYYERTLITQMNKNPTEHLIDLLEFSLESYALKWFSLIKADIRNWTDFEKAFTLKYWSRESQRSIKQKIEQEKYRDNGKLTRAEYFIEKVITLKSITPPMTDDEIIICLTEHYNDIIQDSVRVQNIKTIKDFELLLQREDLRNPQNKARTHTSVNNNNNRFQNNHSSPPRPRNPGPSYHTGQPRNQYNPPPHHSVPERRIPPLFHQAYPPRNNGPNYSSDPPRNSTRNHPYPPRQDNNRFPRSPLHNRPYEPQAAVMMRSPSRNYPSNEQREACNQIIDPRSPSPPRSHNTSPHSPRQHVTLNH